MQIYTPPPYENPEILYQDECLIAVNKPAGLLSVPGRGEDKQDCLVTRVQQAFPTARIVHRLDMATSGIMLLALDCETHRLLSGLFEHRKVEKTYIAVVEGLVKNSRGEIDAPLICDWPNRPRQKVDFEKGKPSTTLYNCISQDKQKLTSRIQFKPITGRSHQLRVHAQYIGHSILGDTLYSSGQSCWQASRLLLHASEISFEHPVDKQSLSIHCEPAF